MVFTKFVSMANHFYGKYPKLFTEVRRKKRFSFFPLSFLRGGGTSQRDSGNPFEI